VLHNVHALQDPSVPARKKLPSYMSNTASSAQKRHGFDAAFNSSAKGPASRTPAHSASPVRTSATSKASNSTASASRRTTAGSYRSTSQAATGPETESATGAPRYSDGYKCATVSAQFHCMHMHMRPLLGHAYMSHCSGTFSWLSSIIEVVHCSPAG
jgi:hypothetical protein